MVNLLLAIIYLSFISLGLPDAILGAAWPTIYPEFQVPISYAGIISMIISLGTIVSSLLSDRLTWKLGTGKVTALSVATTAIALFGFSISDSFIMLCLWAIPYGLGAGCVDAGLNNYAALHYSSRNMNWLHCMWGIGATSGPYIMGFILSNGLSWNNGYRYISFLQIALTAVLFFSLPLWKKRSDNYVSYDNGISTGPLTLKQIFKIKGIKALLISFFCYCALEQTALLWASSYLALHKGTNSETAAFWGSMFCLGLTAGRALSGFLAMKFNDTQMIRLGQTVTAIGVIILFLPMNDVISIVGFILIGLGCAPVYPCIIHSTPAHFGADNSQAIIGVQMAFAYIGTCLMPPCFGLIANHINIGLLPVYLTGILILMVIMHESMLKILKHK
ncbi:MAG: MFS transporter [Schaedlerella sp.]|nr:MFS transporter [Schaedlerella sp.]